jgi:peroxiredoxin
LLLLAAACGGAARRPAAPDPAIGNQVRLTLPSADGAEVDLSSFRGRPAVIHFVTTGSLDGQSDVEELRRTRDARRGLVMAEVVLDDNRALALPWADASAIDWSVLLPTPEVRAGATAFGPIRVVPTTFVVGGDGRVAWRWEGALPRGRLATVLESLAARP